MKEETMRKVLRVKDKLSLCNNKSNLKPREKLSPSFIYSAGVMFKSIQIKLFVGVMKIQQNYIFKRI